jgi:hypothetical protein
MDCGNCTVCCRDLYIPETDSKEGDLCKYCKEGVGCLIYDKRPEACKIFECCWRQMQHAHIDLRPDNCGVCFEKFSDRVIVGSTDDELSKLIIGQISYFQREGISVLIVNLRKKERYYYLAEGHTTQAVEEDIRWRHRHIQKTSQI